MNRMAKSKAGGLGGSSALAEMKIRTFHVLGVPVLDVSMSQALALADRFLTEPKAHSVISINPEKVIQARRDPRMAQILREGDLNHPDGIGAVWAIQMKYRHRPPQTPGVDLMEQMAAKAAREGLPVFFYGAADKVNRRCVENLSRKYPGLVVAGRSHGYLSPREEEALPEIINASGARILFVALGAPKQEYWIRDHQRRLQARWIQGVGGSFDVFSGYVKRAPAWVYNLHLEWVYRLLADFKRLPRYGSFIAFGLLAVAEALGLYRPRPLGSAPGGGEPGR